MNLAKNHVKSQMNAGDMIRFLPGNWGHFARKVILLKESSRDDIRTIPGGFWDGDYKQDLPQDLLNTAWDLASDVYRSCFPENFNMPEYAVSIEVLKYSNSMSELNGLYDLLGDTDSGLWTNFGRKIDIRRGRIISGSPFDKKSIAKIYKYGSRIPGINLFLDYLNRSVFSNYSDFRDGEIVGPPHTDGIRSQTLLAGSRDSIVTEIYDGKSWHEIQLSTDSIYLFPGDYLSKEIGLEPTFHRYSMKKKINTDEESAKPNVTLLLGLLGAANFRSLSKYFD